MIQIYERVDEEEGFDLIIDLNKIWVSYLSEVSKNSSQEKCFISVSLFPLLDAAQLL